MPSSSLDPVVLNFVMIFLFVSFCLSFSILVGSLYMSVVSLSFLLDMNWQQCRLTHASMSCLVTVGGVRRRLCFLAIVLDVCWFSGCMKSVKSLFQIESLL